ncbi:hypothetical protein, partial [Clostridium sp.]|uniref:hypothetical protein n=1 Tax=Clostridium sp. TaxID=1506 RepID=UPI003078D447
RLNHNTSDIDFNKNKATIHIKTVAGIQWRAGLFKKEGWQPDVFGGSFCVIGISLETHSFLFCKFYGSVKEKNTMSGSNKLA